MIRFGEMSLIPQDWRTSDRLTFVWASVCCVAIVAYSQSLYAQRTVDGQLGGRDVVHIQSTEDIVQSWSPDNHLYVKGDVGVGSRQLADLQSWLSENGPHWTVVLMQRAEDEVYIGHDGRRYVGLDAVEYALGYGLSNRTSFGNLEHPTTKETDGAVFALFLNERKFSYFGSDAQDRRKLGEANWVGELDQPAFQAMRAGGRIIDAVKNTVKSINSRLDQAIQAEVDAAERAQRELLRAVSEFRASLASTRQMIDQAEAAATDFRLRFPQATGPLANPPLSDWRRTIDEIDTGLVPDNVRDLEQRRAIVLDEIAKFLNEFAAVVGFDQHVNELQHRFVALRSIQNQEIRQQIERASAIVDKADQARRGGSTVVAELLAQAETMAAAAEKFAAEESRRIEIVQTRWRWIRITITCMLGILLVVAVGLLWLCNRRRRPSMLRAQQEFATREASVRAETDNLDRLFARSGDLLGSTEKISQRGYVGATREVALRALGHVDDLFILSKEVKRVLEEARQLVYPLRPISRLVNLFTRERYEQAIRHLSGKPLKFSKASGLPTIVQEISFGKKSNATPPIVAHSAPDEITLTFEDAYGAFQKRGDDAEAALTEFENALTEIHDVLSSLQKSLETLAENEKKLQQAAVQDGYLAVPNFFETLIPSIQADLASADQLAAFDAVQAMRGPIAAAQRKIADSQLLSLCLDSAHAEIVPVLQGCVSELNALGFSGDWIDAQLDSLTKEADELFKVAANDSVAAQCEQLASNLRTFESRVKTTLDVAKQLRHELRQELQTLTERIDQSRNAFAVRLKLAAATILVEPNLDPDDYGRRAKENLDAAETLLKHGRVEAATESIDTYRAELQRAVQIIDRTQMGIDSYDERVRSLATKLTEVEAGVPRLLAEANRIRPLYTSSALVLSQAPASLGQIDSKGVNVSDESHSVDTVIELASQAAAQASRALKAAGESYRAARILESADQLAHCEHELATSQGCLEQVSQQFVRLEKQNRENQSAQRQSQSTLQTLQTKARDPLIREQTLVDVEQVAALIDQHQRELDIQDRPVDPFATAAMIAMAAKRLDELQAQLVSDAQAHAEAGRAVAGANKQMDMARQFVRQSQSDSIADSPLTTDMSNRIAALQEELAAVERELRVPHGDWQVVDERASRLQTEISSAASTLSQELQTANQALTAFQQAARSVYQAEQWTGAWGSRVAGSPGVTELERARSNLQIGNYAAVLELSRLAAAAALLGIQQAEREVARRRMEEQLANERSRRAREAAMRPPTINIPFGGGFGGGLGGGLGSSGNNSRSTGGSSGSGGNTSGFGRSGW